MNNKSSELLHQIIQKDEFKKERVSYDMLAPETRALILERSITGKDIQDILDENLNSDGMLFDWVGGIKLFFSLAGFVNNVQKIYDRYRDRKQEIQDSDLFENVIELEKESAMNLSNSQIKIVIQTIVRYDDK